MNHINFVYLIWSNAHVWQGIYLKCDNILWFYREWIMNTYRIITIASTLLRFFSFFFVLVWNLTISRSVFFELDRVSMLNGSSFMKLALRFDCLSVLNTVFVCIYKSIHVFDVAHASISFWLCSSVYTKMT